MRPEEARLCRKIIIQTFWFFYKPLFPGPLIEQFCKILCFAAGVREDQPLVAIGKHIKQAAGDLIDGSGQIRQIDISRFPDQSLLDMGIVGE